MPDQDPLATTISGINLRNPLVLAAGTCGYLDEIADVMPLTDVAAITTKSITRSPRDGNHTWRILETRAGMINAIGLANLGIDAWMADVAPRIEPLTRRTGTRVIGSIAGYSIDDYAHVAQHMARATALAAVELNVSCPNVHGGTEFGLDPAALRELIAAARQHLPIPIFVKLSPIVAAPPGFTIADIARAAIDAGANALSLCNTVPAMAIDVHTRKPRLANVTGGLSGPAVHLIAVKIIHDVYRKVAKDAGIPILGIGGVLTWEDAAEFILAGASAVQLGTALFVDPRAPRRIARGLARWVRHQHQPSIADLVGGVAL